MLLDREPFSHRLLGKGEVQPAVQCDAGADMSGSEKFVVNFRDLDCNLDEATALSCGIVCPRLRTQTMPIALSSQPAVRAGAPVVSAGVSP
jgi:hypothetical protein